MPVAAKSEPMLTITPRRAGSMWRAAAWAQRNVPVRLTASVRDQTAKSSSSEGPIAPTPALFTRTSRRPGSAMTASNSSLTCPASETAARRGVAARPASRRPVAVVLASCSSRSAITTLAPCAASSPAIAAPRPRPAPVITATRPSSIGRTCTARARAARPGRLRLRGRSASSIRPVTAPTVVILAAGQGTRMRSRTPKVLHDLCGQPMIAWPVAAALAAGAGKVVVVDGPQRPLEGHLPDAVELAVQPEANGTGGGVQAAAAHPGGAPGVLLNGDVPLVTAEALSDLIAAHAASDAQATVASMELDDPTGYGRVVRRGDASVERVVETKAQGDATPEELAIREVNAGVYAYDGAALKGALERLTPDNAQGELYLPSTLELLDRVAAHALDDPTLLLGVNDRADLARVRGLAQARIHRRHMRAGVTIVDPTSTLVDVTVAIGADTVIEPSSFLRGATTVGERCVVGPLTTLIDAALGDEVRVPHSYLVECEVRAGASVGPFAYLRPGALLRERAKAGTFVEIKNSDIGQGTKVPHLSYIGDADVGPNTNLGAATITSNYDGYRKHRTTIGADVRTSVDTTLVAPVTIGDGAYTAANSAITDDVPPGALGIARERQTNIEGYAERRKKREAPDTPS